VDNFLAEECPFCFKERKFYVHIRTGQYNCYSCQEHGNVTSFMTWFHRQCLDKTTPAHWLALMKKRGIHSQTLKSHDLAYDDIRDRWLIAFRNEQGNVVNLQSYYPNKATKPNKYNLPGLPIALYGFDKLLADKAKSKRVLLCEGVFDAIAVDYLIGAHNRQKYVIMAAPDAGSFQEAWVPHFAGHKVSVLSHNDDAGRKGSAKTGRMLTEGDVKEVKVLRWPDKFSQINDLNALARDPEGQKLNIVGWVDDNCHKVARDAKLIIYHGRGPAAEQATTEWIWQHHLCCGTYASLSGQLGTMKTTIAIDIAARYTRGEKMPTMSKGKGAWLEPTMPAGHVLYLYCEDDRPTIEKKFEWAEGDFDKWHCQPALIQGEEYLNILDHLPELRETIREYGIRLVIIDGQNSVVGTPNISTDMLARCNVTNKLHQFAQQQNICLWGLRNEDTTGRALGPQSMADMGRCIMRAVRVKKNPFYGQLEFIRISKTAPLNYPDLPYGVKNHDGFHSEILWGRSPLNPEVELARNIARTGTLSGRAPRW
jgi:hypothetical protein